MRVIESFVMGKKDNQDLCEDGIFFSENFAAVIDGATSKSKNNINDKNPGRLAMELIKSALNLLPADAKADEAIKIISEQLAHYYKKYGLYSHLQESFVDRPTASVIIYSLYHHEIWAIGDCHALVDNKYINNDKLLDRVMSEARSCYLQAEIKAGVSLEELMENDTGRAFILPMLKKQGVFQNNAEKSEFSYEVIDGYNHEHTQVVVIDTKGAREIVLASDGYPRLFSTLHETEEFLKKVVKEDPLCFQIYKSTKGLEKGNSSFDDRSYLRFEV